MRAAEKLIAQRGMENVSIRDIVSAAKQKNESALQYHFKNFSGLINAIAKERAEQTQAKRAELLSALSATGESPSLRDICLLMVQPAYELARAHADFRLFIKAFGHNLIMTDSSPLALASMQGGGGASGKQIGTMLKTALPHLDAKAYQRRMDAAVLLCAASMYQQSRATNAFKGAAGELFLHSLADALVGLLRAPVSAETQSLKKK